VPFEHLGSFTYAREPELFGGRLDVQLWDQHGSMMRLVGDATGHHRGDDEAVTRCDCVLESSSPALPAGLIASQRVVVEIEVDDMTHYRARFFRLLKN
jgi:hypothetical protein